MAERLSPKPLSRFNLSNADLTLFKTHFIKPDLIIQHRIIPLTISKNKLRVGLADLTHLSAVPLIAFHTGMIIEPVLVDGEELDELIERHCRPHVLNYQLESTLSRIPRINEASIQAERRTEEPIANYLTQLFIAAVNAKASDIHIEPQHTDYRIRFRSQGILHETARIPTHLALRVITRLKVLANVNMAEKRLPQDGRIQLKEPRLLDIRLSTCPTLHGEKIALRLLDKQAVSLGIEHLGMTSDQQLLFTEHLAQPQGLILVCGPTGSGKTMTLYSALNHLNSTNQHIMTVEDPIEVELEGINQIAVHSQIGLDFAKALRMVLRQDPDIIMIGEIRDYETANIALQASQTGHLVLATLHASTADESLARLQTLNVNTNQLAYSLSLIIAQRLVQSTHGRTGIFECIKMSRHKFNAWQASGEIETDGPSLAEAAKLKISANITTDAAVKRVLGK